MNDRSIQKSDVCRNFGGHHFFIYTSQKILKITFQFSPNRSYMTAKFPVLKLSRPTVDNFR